MKKNISKIIDIVLIIGASSLIGINCFILVKNKEIVKALNFENYKIENNTNIKLENENKPPYKIDILSEKPTITNCNIFIKENGFYIKDSLLKINGMCPIYLLVNNEHSINYNSINSSLIIDDDISIINIGNINNIPKGINTFSKMDTNEKIIVAQKPFKENLLSISSILKDEENEKEEYNKLNSLLNNSYIGNIDIKYSINGLNINNEWSKEIIITKDFITLKNENKTIYISKYNGKIDEDGFEKEISINSKILKYGNYINEETNNTIYVIDDITPIQILIPKDIDIKNIFI